MNTTAFALIVFLLYAFYYTVNIMLDLGRANKVKQAAAQASRNTIPATYFKEAEETVQVIKPFQAKPKEVVVDAAIAKKVDEVKEKEEKPPVRISTTALELETLTYGVVVSPETVAAMFAE